MGTTRTQHTADSLAGAVAGLLAVALTVADRMAVLRVLDEPPAGPLAQFRAALLQEQVGRVRDGLV